RLRAAQHRGARMNQDTRADAGEPARAALTDVAAPTRAPAQPRSGASERRGRSHVLSNILAIAYKEATALRHDQAFLVTVIAQPIMLLLLYGFALSNKPANVPWAVLDQSRTAASRRFIAEVQSTGYFLAPLPVANYDEGRALLKGGKAVAFVIVPSDFRREAERTRPRVQVLLDGTDPITAARVGGY